LPDQHCTPGSVQATSTKAVCTPGWASRHRHVTAATRALIYRRYGLRGPHPFPEWEVDHRIPLELGGSNAITNLWPSTTHKPKTASKTAFTTGSAPRKRLSTGHRRSSKASGAARIVARRRLSGIAAASPGSEGLLFLVEAVAQTTPKRGPSIDRGTPP
jgi:hypothetical protein